MNRLAHESSPYLLAHADNPVDWYPWGAEAHERARREDRPIFLSIGYSACHWCHVMEHESFENREIAALLNERFIAIKVDREERPDLDQVYMSAVQLMTGRGGWPMSVFLTPDLKPFYGGTYWPPHSRMGMAGFDQVIAAVADAWRERREQVFDQAAHLTEHLQETLTAAGEPGEPEPELLRQAGEQLLRAFDSRHGGFGQAPKFPHPMDLQLLLRVWRRSGKQSLLDAATLTLDKMAAGGIYDQLGGGFHRYSVDERWLVPHFEKMLYDNALLAGAYVDAFLATGNANHARVARETCDYVLREMTDSSGGFHSTQDADSEGEEGKFFVWTPSQIEAALGPDKAKTFCQVYDVTPEGNFEHRNILNLPKTIDQCAVLLGRGREELATELAASRAALLAARSGRVAPSRDDKVLVSWNGLMLDALARAADALAEPRYLAAAVKAAEFLTTALRKPDGRLYHAWRHGQARFDAYLDDYAALANGLVSLHEATFDSRWLDEAARLAAEMMLWFRDPTEGGFFFTSHDHEPLLARGKDLFDNATPSGSGLAVTALARLAKFTGRADFLDAARATLRAAMSVMRRSPMAGCQMLLGYDLLVGPTPELVIVGEANGAETQAVIGALRGRYWPTKVVAVGQPDEASKSESLAPLFAGKTATADAPNKPTLYLCEGFACQAPIVGKEAILEAIDKLAAMPAGGLE